MVHQHVFHTISSHALRFLASVAHTRCLRDGRDDHRGVVFFGDLILDELELVITEEPRERYLRDHTEIALEGRKGVWMGAAGQESTAP